jgi:uncharacterized protein YdaU (DUF1376 family)
MSADQFSGPWLPWFHGDFLRATQGWTLLERGAYFMLLGASWEMGALPTDHLRLAGIIGAQLDEFEELWKVVGPKFEVTDQGLLNQRLELHRSKQATRREKARQSANLRWSGNTENHVDASASANGHANGHANAYAIGDAQGHAPAMLPDPDPDPDLRAQSTDPKQPPAHAATASAIAPFHQEVIDVYHELCPGLPKVITWTPQRAQLLEDRIRECKVRGRSADTIEYWRRFFRFVTASDFLAGREGKFRANLEWLLKPDSFQKVIENHYNSSRSSNGSNTHA